MTTLQRLVVGVDGSEGSSRALEWAVSQAALNTGTAAEERPTATLVHGFSPGVEAVAAMAQIDLDGARSEYYERLAGPWSEPARRAGVDFEVRFLDEYPADALLYVADEIDADAVVIGHQGTTAWSRHHIGGTAAHLLHHCDRTLILTNSDMPTGPLSGPLLVALGRLASEDSPDVYWAAELAKERELPLVLTMTIETPFLLDTGPGFDTRGLMADMADRLAGLGERVAKLHDPVKTLTEIREGPAARTYAELADDHEAGLVVVGTRHPGWLSSVFGGSVARVLPPMLHCPMAAVSVEPSDRSADRVPIQA